mgnify:CR=1 FL=1
MKKISVLLALMLMSGWVNAGQINVTWHQPDDYVDIEGAEESQKRFQTKTFKQFEKYFAKLAKKLPAEVSVNLKVTDLNLAGDVRYNFALQREIRMVSHVYWPMIEFEYQVKSGEQEIASGNTKLKDMSFMDRGHGSRGSQKPLSYETRMLSTWFKKDVQNMITQWQKHQTAVMAE